MTFLLGIAGGYLLAFIYEKTMLFLGKKLKRNSLIVSGYKFHHSIYGLLAILISLLIEPRLFLLSLGLGVIVQHYFTGDGLVFITREKH